MPKTSAVVQGAFVSESLDVIANIRESGIFDEVIFSGWDSCAIPRDVECVKSAKPDNSGIGNRNLQIVSSLAGVKALPCRLDCRADLPRLQIIYVTNFAAIPPQKTHK